MRLKAIINTTFTKDAMPDYKIRIFNVEGPTAVFKEESTLSDIATKGIESFILNLPAEMLNFRIVRLPALGERKLREIIPLDIENSILIKREDLVFDFIVENAEDSGVDALVSYLDKRDFQKIIAPLKEKGIIISSATCIQVRAALSEGIKGFAKNLVSLPNITPEESLELECKEVLCPTLSLKDNEIETAGIRVQYLKPLFKTAGLMLLLMLTLLLWFSLSSFWAQKELRTLQREMRDSYLTLFPEDSKVKDEVYQLKSKIKGLRDKAESLLGIKAIDILSRLANSKVEGIAIIELVVEKETLRIVGEAPGIEVIESYKRKLSWLQNPEVSKVTQGEKGAFTFTIAGRIKAEL